MSFERLFAILPPYSIEIPIIRLSGITNWKIGAPPAISRDRSQCL
jgi:hypothetical protein